MKEYLVKDTVTGYYFLTKNHSNFVGAIEVPEWASLATVLESGALKLWDAVSFERCPSGYIIWQRESLNDKPTSAEQYRQAEVLPFIDDEPHKSREWDLSDYDFADSDAWIESNVEQDNVNNPSHYADSAIECIDAMQAMLTPEQFVGYLRGNILKYQWRYEKKNGIEDLRKSQWYLDKLISVL